MSEKLEPLLGKTLTRTMQIVGLSGLDQEFSLIGQSLESYFASKTIDLGFQVTNAYLSTYHQKMFVCSENLIGVFDLKSSLLERSHNVNISGVCSITGYEDMIFVSTGSAELIQFSYPDFAEVKRVTIGANNLYVSCKNPYRVWAVSYGYTIYYYDIEKDSIVRIGAFPWASGMSVSNDEKYLVAFRSTLFRVYSKNLRFDEIEINEFSDISSIGFSADSNLMLCSHYEGIVVYTTEDWTELRRLQAFQTNLAKFYGRNNYIVYFSDSKISVWNPYNASTEQEFIYGARVTRISVLEIDELNNCAYINDGENSLYKHVLPLSNFLTFSTFIPNGNIAFSPFSDYGYFLEYTRVKKVDIEKLDTEEKDFKSIEIEVTCPYCFSEDALWIYAKCGKKIVRLSSDFEIIDSMDYEEEYYQLIIEINSTLYVASQGLISVLDFSTKLQTKIVVPDIIVTSIIRINGCLYISHLMSISRIRLGTIEFTHNSGHESDILGMFQTSGNELLSISSNCAKLWLPGEFKEIRVFRFEIPVKCAYVDSAKNLFYVGTQNSIIGYLLPGFVEFFNLITIQEVCKVSLGAKGKYILAVLWNCNLIRVINPAGPDFNVCSNYIDSEKIIQTLKGTITEYDARNDKWIIFPYGLNAMHCYTYFNKSELLRSSFDSNAAYIDSGIGDPISIALSKNYRECINVILSCLRFRVTKDFYALSCIQDKLAELNKGSYKGLDELYEASFVRDANPKLAQYCSDKTVLPKINRSQIISISGFLSEEEQANKSIRVEYYTTTLAVSFNVGSKESIEFLKSLQECENTDIFQTRFIKSVLEMKWNIVYKFVLLQSLLYFLYLISLVLYILNGESAFLIGCFALNCLLLIYELIQMMSGLVEYLSDYWNIIDIVRSILLLVYCVCLQFGETYNVMLFALTALTMIKGITLFRLFSKTRYMISLLSQVFASLTAFSGVLLYSTFTFALLSLTIGDDYSNDGILTQISNIYTLQIGGFEVQSDWGYMRWIIFISSTIVGLVIMMNLLISLLGDTYSQVQESAEIEDLKQLIEMILEIENFYFWNKNTSDKEFIQVCESFKLSNSSNPIVKKLTKIKMIAKDLKETLKQLAKPVEIEKMNEASLKKIKDETIASKMEILNVLVDLNIKISELSMSEAKALESESEYIPICLKGHFLTETARSAAYCDLCKQYIGTLAMSCGSCNFDMCQGCINWIKSTQLCKVSLCYKGHELRESKVEELKPHDVDSLPLFCRCCNNEVSEEIVNYCRYCAYALCMGCKGVIVQSKLIVNKTKCSKGHELKWVIDSHYTSNSNILSCSECRTKYLGAGTFSCTSCKYNMCMDCFKRKYI